MANIDITYTSGFSVAYYPGLSNAVDDKTWSAPTSVKWYASSGATFLGRDSDPRGIVFEISNFALESITDNADDPNRTRTIKTRNYKYSVRIVYPDSVVDFGADYTLYFSDNKQYSSTTSSLSPSVVSTISTSVYGNSSLSFKVWPELGTVDGHTVTYPIGVYAFSRGLKSPVTQLIWNWGDGTVDTIPLEATPDDRVGGETYYDGATNQSFHYSTGNLTSPVSHTFTPDANGNGSGVPISIIAVDNFGRKSKPLFSKIGPHAELEIGIEESTNSVLVSSKPTYGRTGKITQQVATRLGPSFDGSITPRPPDIAPDKWRVGAAMSGPYYAYSRPLDSYTNPIYATVGYSAGETQNDPSKLPVTEKHWYFHRPPFSALPWPDGSSIIARETGENPSRSSFYRKLVNEKNLPTFSGFTAPRLFREGAVLYCAGRAQNGTTRLWRSFSFEQPWEELSMIWPAEFYHAEVVSLIGGGAACLAVKRVAVSETTYDVELWFRKTFDLSNWESEPVKVVTLSSAIPLEGTFGLYPLLINEALAGRAPRLLAGTNANLTHKSADAGVMWSAL